MFGNTYVKALIMVCVVINAQATGPVLPKKDLSKYAVVRLRIPELTPDQQLVASLASGNPAKAQEVLDKDKENTLTFAEKDKLRQRTALVIAARKGYHKITETIVTRQPGTVTVLDDDKRTALCHAIYMGEVETVKLLLKHGGAHTVTWIDNKGNAAYAYARGSIKRLPEIRKHLSYWSLAWSLIGR